MNKFTIFFLLVIGLSLNSFAQKGWDWPDNEEDSMAMVEKHTMYTDNLRLGEYSKARKPLQWIIARQPTLNESIYIHGAKIYEETAKETEDEELLKKYQDSSLAMYELRVKYFPDEKESVYSRYPYTYYRYYYKDISRYADIYALFNEAFELLGNDIPLYNLSAYMNLVNYYFRYKPDEMPKEEVLNAYDLVSGILNYQREQGAPENKLATIEDRVDAILVNSGIELTCSEIEDRYVQKFRDDKSNIDLAKKVIAYSLQFKCTNEAFFVEAAAALLEKEPSASLAKTIGDRYLNNQENDKAIEFYNKALDLEEDNLKRADLLYKIGQSYVMKGSKPTARQFAEKALAEDPSKKEAYTLIGNLYFNSAAECKEGESIVADRSIYIAAYEMYQRAGDQQKMQQAKEQFPSKEELFTEDFYEGNSYQVGCWINTTVTLKVRD